ncbi:WPP domain-interacting tail-anchored protein 1 [Vigna radiata var. radiata]|uniref:WPP domain-interacting tail-anchored protein 1 n=1 Tax=Vigna radiata var. radiata TaxID=3916 RepID=A0A1S3TRX9_VIGRR|nr:WPP domain-interacting tail-anchored protein 1 [Vigna radiata var. radiata]XP_022635779.1 WPP domain-interacting tail-anchored protein 1 [Vigna radiata var. radiata]
MDTQSAKGTVDIDLGGVSSSGEAAGDLGDDTVTMLGGLELNRACFSEKVANLSNFVMHLEALEVELEGFVLDREDNDVDVGCVGKFLEFDLLCGVLGSEVVELDRFLDALHAEIADAGDRAASCKPWQDNLLDSEQSLKQSEEQFSEIKKLSASFERTLSSYKWGGNDNVEDVEITLEDDESLNVSPVITMHTTEQQRLVLRMLEKSLANEMDLEKNFFDSRKIEENLKQRMASLEQKLSLVEEEATDVWERWLEADNTREILIGISKELLGRLQISQFNLNGLSQRESVLRAKLETPLEQLAERDVTSDQIEQLNGKLVLANSEVATLRDKVCSLEKQLKESESQLINVKASADAYQKQYTVLCSEVRETEGIILELKENISNAESQANTAEANCKLLAEANSELNRQIALSKDSVGKSERAESLERRLRESDLLLQHAVASAEASLEKQNMLYSTIKDMEQVIKDLKSKVSKAESRADNAEEKCILLSESNTDLNEELRFLKSRLHCLEGSLHQVEETKVASAKDIGKQTKVFKSLVMQLAVERERLNKQLSSLASENKILVVKLKQTNKYPQEVSVALTTDQHEDRTWKNSSTNDDNEEKFADSMPDADSVRRIDAGVLNFKHLFMLSVLVLLFSAVTYLNVDVNF